MSKKNLLILISIAILLSIVLAYLVPNYLRKEDAPDSEETSLIWDRETELLTKKEKYQIPIYLNLNKEDAYFAKYEAAHGWYKYKDKGFNGISLIEDGSVSDVDKQNILKTFVQNTGDFSDFAKNVDQQEKAKEVGLDNIVRKKLEYIEVVDLIRLENDIILLVEYEYSAKRNYPYILGYFFEREGNNWIIKSDLGIQHI